MQSVDVNRQLDVSRSNFGEANLNLDGYCGGGGNASTFAGATRKTSPFDGSSHGNPVFFSHLSKPADNSSGSVDSDLSSVLRKLINWVAGQSKTDNAENSSPLASNGLDTKPGEANQSTSEKQLLAIILVLLVTQLGKNKTANSENSGVETSTDGTGASSPLKNAVDDTASKSGMDSDLISLLKDTIGKLSSSDNQVSNTSADTKSLIDRLFGDTSATAGMDPTLLSMLKELVTILLQKQSGSNSASSSPTNDDQPSPAADGGSIADTVSKALDSSSLAQSLDPALLSILKELLTYLSGGRKDGSATDPMTPSKADDRLDSSSSSTASSSELQSLLSKLLQLLSGDDGSSAGPTAGGPATENTVRDTRSLSPENSATNNVKPEDGTPSFETSLSPSDSSLKGQVNVVDKPIVVDGGVFDGKGATYTASSKLGDGGQAEDQKPIFILRNGATLKNVDLGENGADGIHVYGGATLENVNWQNVGEDALTVKSAGDVNIFGCSALGGVDKIFQVNADSTIHLKDFSADGFTSLVRTNGGKQLNVDVTIDGGSFKNGANLFRTDSSTASVEFLGDISLANVKNWKREGDIQSGV